MKLTCLLGVQRSKKIIGVESELGLAFEDRVPTKVNFLLSRFLPTLIKADSDPFQNKEEYSRHDQRP